MPRSSQEKNAQSSKNLLCLSFLNNRYTRSSIGIDEVKFQLHHLVRKILEVQIKHCFREANQCVDRLAKTGTKLERDFIVYESPPSVIILMLFYDCTGMYFERLRPNFVT